MKNKFYLPWLMILLAVAGCSKTDSDDHAAPDKGEDHSKPRVTVDAETQEKMGVELGSPTVAEWRPGVAASGRVLDPLQLSDSLADLRHAEVVSKLARQEFERVKQLKEQNNISTKTFQEAEGSYLQSETDLAAAQRKIEANWGKKIVALAEASVTSTNEAEAGVSSLEQFTNATALVRVDLPMGVRASPDWAMVRISSLAENSTPLEGTHFDQLPVMDPQTQQVGILVTVDQPATNRLIPGEVVQAALMGNEKLTGLKLPASAVLRYEGKGWVYVQSNTNQFVRIEVPLERELDAGYFIEKELSATNRIIVTGAQSVLSAELGGGFTTGERD